MKTLGRSVVHLKSAGAIVEPCLNQAVGSSGKAVKLKAPRIRLNDIVDLNHLVRLILQLGNGT